MAKKDFLIVLLLLLSSCGTREPKEPKVYPYVIYVMADELIKEIVKEPSDQEAYSHAFKMALARQETLDVVTEAYKNQGLDNPRKKVKYWYVEDSLGRNLGFKLEKSIIDSLNRRYPWAKHSIEIAEKFKYY